MPFIFKGKQERDIECSLETNPFFCKKHYLYRHIRLDKNIPFYIGVGSHSRRQLYKRAFDYTLSGRRSAKWYDIFNKSPVTVDIIFESNNRDEIFEKEKEFISL